MRRNLIFSTFWIVMLIACQLTSTQVPPTPIESPALTNTTFSAITDTITPLAPTATQIVSVTQTEPSTEAPLSTNTSLPTVESLKATVTGELLSCRYGPGAEYLYLYALRKTANIQLIGRTDGNNWVWVEGKNKCWVNTKFLEIQGDPLSLPMVYPGIAKLPVSPYYPGPSWANAIRKGDKVEVTWEAVPISAGKYEDENMHQYIVEVWRCESGQIIFETLGTNFPFITVEKDKAGCSVPSHGNVFVQEKHGYGGPIKIPWPEHR
jgi:uncharacterized protein YraI